MVFCYSSPRGWRHLPPRKGIQRSFFWEYVMLGGKILKTRQKPSCPSIKLKKKKIWNTLCKISQGIKLNYSSLPIMVPSYTTLPPNPHHLCHCLPLPHGHLASLEKQQRKAHREASRENKVPSFQKRSREGQPNEQGNTTC